MCYKRLYKNIVLSIITFGFLFSITTTVYHIVDEKDIFYLLLNIADGNFNYINKPITDGAFHNIEFNNPSINLAIDYFGENIKKINTKFQKTKKYIQLQQIHHQYYISQVL